MPLDRHQQVARIWDWLPAFRAAAEYESLQRAGLALSVSPSALSRSIKLLEDELGVTLFSRSPTGLTLTEQGQRLLLATREAMRQVYDALPQSTPNWLRAGAVGPALQNLLCDAAVEALPGWSLVFTDVTLEGAAERLRSGDLDLALTHAPTWGPGLAVCTLPSLAWVLAVAPGGSRDQVACLGEPPFTWPGAAAIAANVDQLITLGRRLALAVFAPAYAVPAGWAHLEQHPPQPVFLVRREYRDEAPPHFAKLVDALSARLSS